MTGRVTVAAVQTRPVIGEVDVNLAAIAEAVTQAAERGATLVVLPELCTTGYVFASREEAAALAEEIPSGPSTRFLTGLSARLGVHLVAGIAEREGDLLYNSAVLLGPDGHLGTYRKVHLWDNENTIFEPGNLGLPVFDTAFGRLGMLICYDAWFPEAFQALALQGVDAVCLPTNWVPIPGQQPGKPAMALSLCQAAAHVNSIHVIAADRVGTEREQPFIGQSIIVGPTGWPLTEPAGSQDPETVLATADLTDGRRLRRWNTHNDPLANRRPEVYAPYGDRP
ncbi:nitrilase family protein [Streptomyces sp. NBC_00988]|uniref:nitrilase family protein n=1 Tax=Streptomyces sp. NBC_00988 TaxID=2903704 RepID=UPI00386FDC13|nr:nitrilase family protein [Streptomyces sp. NBC_00988]